MTDPDLVIASPDGTRIASFASGLPGGHPLVLVHGAMGDHTTFRSLGPRLAITFALHAIDRRGRGASGDSLPYSIEREFEDVAAVADALAAGRGGPIDVVGHSYGGRVALGAALRTDSIRRVVCYEGAPAPPGVSYQPAGMEDRLRRHLTNGDRDGALATFMTEAVGMSADELVAYRANPVWPVRAATADRILRELEADTDSTASLEVLGGVGQPVLQILGSDSISGFREATFALHERLPAGRVVVIEGARHAAHHTHPDALAEVIRTFLT